MSEKPQSEKPQGDKTQGEKTQGDNPADGAATSGARAKSPRTLRKWLLPAMAGLLVVGGGGALASYVLSARATATAERRDEVGGLVTFEPFLVNVEGAQLLRTNVSLAIRGAHRAEELESDEVIKTRLRSVILELLAAQNAQVVATAAGKAGLRTAVKERTGALVGREEVVDVLFTDFVIQY